MSADIWLNIQKAVRDIRPDLAKDFEKCRDKQSIGDFLNLHFPLKGMVEPGNWHDHLMIKTPDMLKAVEQLRKDREKKAKH